MPSIGMHNMKENEYLSAAQGAVEHGDWWRRRTHINGLVEGPGYFEEYPQIPLLPWAVAGSWKLLGRGFWQARLPIVLAAAATIPVLDAFALRLTGDALLALASAFLLAIAPEHVFFGRNLQPEAPALLAALLGSIAALRFLERERPRDALASGLWFALAGAFKYSFLVLAVPLAAVALAAPRPREGTRPPWLRAALAFSLGFMPLVVWSAVVAPRLNVSQPFLAGTLPRVHPLEAFTPAYWRTWGATIIRYAVLDHTLGMLLLALVGFAVVLVRGPRALRAWAAGSFASLALYAAVFSDYLRGHSYYQFPFLPLVCVAAAAAIATVARIAGRARGPAAAAAVAALGCAALVPSALRAASAHFDTAFYGVDVTARALKERSRPEDRVFVFGHEQSLAVCYNADRIGARNPSAPDMVRGEEELGFRFAFIHAATGGLDIVRGDPAVRAHLESGYRIVEMTFLPRRDGAPQIETLLLAKGGACDLGNLGANAIARPSSATPHRYDTSRGPLVLYSVDAP